MVEKFQLKPMNKWTNKILARAKRCRIPDEARRKEYPRTEVNHNLSLVLIRKRFGRNYASSLPFASKIGQKQEDDFQRGIEWAF
jgi:hypothetical protein